MSARLSLALSSGDLTLPPEGTLSVVTPSTGFDLSELPRGRVEIVQPFKPHFDQFQQLGFECVSESELPCSLAVICLPRAKAQARALVFQACKRSDGFVVVDGAKTDGIDSLLKDVRKRVELAGQLSKAHGKIFWFRADAAAFSDWAAPETQMADGFVTAPGVFSADGIDPASEFLASCLPGKGLGRRISDLGGGWGFLTARMLTNKQIETIDLVEANHTALDCARRNLDDPRVRFHWSDATDWIPDGRIDAVVMNPPFHEGRAADPSLGRAFIATAARILGPSGGLWMVANRHLPYEAALAERFSQVQEVAGTNRFKVFHATRPARTRR